MMPSRLIEKFKKYLEQLGYSKGSIYMLPMLIKEFLQHTKKGSYLETITTEDIQQFMEYLDTRPLKRRQGIMSESMKNHYTYALRKFFIWLEESEQLEVNPVSNYEFKHYAAGTRQPLSQKEILSLFEVTENYREKSLLHLFYSCGLRRTEAVMLETTDIDFKKKLLYVREGKGCKRRVIPFTGTAKKDFYTYLFKERKEATSKNFIIGQTGIGMRGDRMNMIIRALGKKAGINKSFSLHHLRHSIATHLLEQGIQIDYVKNFLGHSGLESTQIYTKVKRISMKDF